MTLVEEYIRFLCSAFLKNCSNTILNIAGTTEHITKMLEADNIPRISYDEALRVLSPFEGCLRYDKENQLTFITAKGEQELIRQYNGFVWLTHMDKKIVPFYQATADGIHASCADLLFGIGESVGCGERHATGAQVINALSEHQVDNTPYEWYIRMKERYPLKTAGFGMGTERFILWLLKQDDIRDCQLLPRFNGEVFIP